MKKKLLCALIAVILIMSCLSAAFAESYTLTNSAQVMHYVQRDGKGRMSVGPATLTVNGKSENVYYVAMAGTNFTFKQYNNPLGYILSTMSVSSAYFRAAKQAALDNIPAGSKVIFFGHSFGGTVAQQLAGDKTLKSKYEIVNVLACGSPYIIVGGREGSLHRLAYRNDPIPVVSVNALVNPFLNVSFENSKKPLDMFNTHATGYMDESVWYRYDVLGVKGGNAVLDIDKSASVGYYLELFS